MARFFVKNLFMIWTSKYSISITVQFIDKVFSGFAIIHTFVRSELTYDDIRFYISEFLKFNPIVTAFYNNEKNDSDNRFNLENDFELHT